MKLASDRFSRKLTNTISIHSNLLMNGLPTTSPTCFKLLYNSYNYSVYWYMHYIVMFLLQDPHANSNPKPLPYSLSKNSSSLGIPLFIFDYFAYSTEQIALSQAHYPPHYLHRWLHSRTLCTSIPSEGPLRSTTLTLRRSHHLISIHAAFCQSRELIIRMRWHLTL
jgi:hypothetical protein